MTGEIVLDTGLRLNAYPTSWKMALATLRFVAAQKYANGARVTINGVTREYFFDRYRRVRRAK